MNETLRLWLTTARALYSKLSTTKKILLGVGVVVVLLAAAGVSYIAKQDPHQLLYSDLQPEETRGVAKKLSEQNIPYRVSEDNTALYVPASRVADARMELAKEGMPGQDVVGFEKFDNSTIGMSSYVQRIQYVRAVQGELTRSIQRLSSVKRARVHISVPPKKTFLEEQDPPKASVVLELRSGQAPTKAETLGIAHLVASAVEGLRVNQVTIVDNRGSFLHRPEDSSGANIASTALLELQRSIESEYEKRIEDILGPVVGPGKVRAKVTAEVEMARVNTTEETYDPDKAVAKSLYKVDEVTSGQKPNPVGIPGSRSNLPGTEVDNPPVPVASTSSDKNTTNTNYAIPRKIQITDKPSGSIKRLTVAVVVDGVYAKGAPGATDVFSPRSDEELKRIQEVVANAVGFDQTRRDSISVTSMPFGTVDLLGLAEENTNPGAPKEDLLQHGIRNGAIALVLLLFFFFVARPFLKWATSGDLEAEVLTYPRTVAELEAGVGGGIASLANLPPGAEAAAAENVLALNGASTFFEEQESMEKKEENELRKRIEERLANSLKKGSRIVQDWLEEEMPSSPLQPLENAG